ncbi:MAG TPA: DUF3160 domain-containing protein [Symbiobacteriaceae bacterium]|nr:DUF3160 domain-containing protein [Symbiobacteriaceae bacterium]
MFRRTFAAVICLALLLGGCTSSKTPPGPPAPPAEPAPTAPETPAPPVAPELPPTASPVDREALLADSVALGLGFLSGRPAPPVPGPGPYAPPTVKAAVPNYHVATDLGNIANLAQFGTLTGQQRALLAQNRFVAAPTDFIQPFFLYENNTYLDVPSFITTDSVLHTFHMFYDWAMRGVEYTRLYPDLADLTAAMLKKATAAYDQATTPNRKAAALDAVVFFGVPHRLLGLPGTAPEAAAPLIERELAKIERHAGREQLSFLPYTIDYTAFIPRGHYTRSERFAQYFRAMTWYGTVPFPLPEAGREPGPAEIEAARAALLIAGLIGPDEEKLWRNIYEATALFVGLADDATPLEYRTLAAGVMAGLEDDAIVRDFIKKAMAELKAPGIHQQLEGIPTGPQMRFMGQRFVLDSAVLQGLVQWPQRPVPTGLDIAAAWGSARAKEILLGARKEGEKWPAYPARLQTQTARVAAVPPAEWQSNLYRGWLWTYQPLLAAKGEGYPAFMRSPAWQEKMINTVLGSWTQVRHDTILYVKPSGAQCGGDDEIPPPPPGYVEPEPEFYARLAWLVRSSLAWLTERGLLDQAMYEQFESFAVLLEQLQGITAKELTGEALTREEKDLIRFYGARLEHLSIRALGGYKGWYELASEVDKEMAVVADVHVSGGTVLQEAVGRPGAVLVAFPEGGKVWLGRGAIYTYYEFLHPAADRMTDEAWLAQVQAHQTPPQPDWTASFISSGKVKVIEPEVRIEVPCGGNGSGGRNPG